MKVGILGNGMIVPTAIEGLQAAQIPVTSLWCRKKEKGLPITEKYNIPSIYTDIEVFLSDETFDTVYIGLANSVHYEYATKAIQAHKNVIVEKPFTSNSYEANELVNMAKLHHVYIFEAILTRYSKNYETIRTYLDKLGNIKLVQANYSQYSSRYDAYKRKEVAPAFDPKLSGGALVDLNVYNIHFVSGLFGMPKEVHYFANKGFNGIDTSGIAILDYGTFKAVCSAAKDSSSMPYTMIQGELGTIEIYDRPGQVNDVTFYDVKTKQKTKLNLVKEEDPFKAEFQAIQETIDTNNVTVYNTWLERTLITQTILDMCRKYADISFDDGQANKGE